MNFQKIEKEIGGRKLIIETGKLAKQASGSAMVRYGDTIVLATVVSQNINEYLGFFPLTVEYREKISAVGRIPGGFYKREGRPTTKEILTMRLIDRPIRPLFSEWYNQEVQIIISVLSADQENDPDVVSIIASSAALTFSDIPFQGPIAGIRVGKIKDKFVLNPTYAQLEESELDLILAGTDKEIIMVEGSADEVSEDIIVDAICWGQEQIKDIILMQKELKEKIGIKSISEPKEPEEYLKTKAYIEENYNQKIKDCVFIKEKKNREKLLENLYMLINSDVKQKINPDLNENIIKKSYEKIQKNILREVIIKQKKRIDGRNLDEIRKIVCEVGILPRTHGSALFTRGETQALVTTTLGTPMDEQIVDGLIPEFTKRFLLHYNFPPFSVGEVRGLRGPSRRDIGHGALAEKSLEPVIPEEKRFPYTIRLVSDILESNGSSSMASICGGTLALMDSGVPIRKPVGGIAMGLIKDNDNYYVLSDIMGMEDHYGDMDFKVAGTQRGVTALQLDIKIDGINREILKKALEQAKEGRIYILREMMSAIDRPKSEISMYAPRVITIKVNPEKISSIIGSGGKTIRHIQEKTNSKIEVEADGTVKIYSSTKEGAFAARDTIEQLTEEVKVGKIYKGKVTSVKDFGAFVEIIPGLEGLVHVSELEKNYVQNVGDIVKIGDEITVKVLAVDDQNRIKLSKRAVDKEQAKKD